MDDEKDTAGVLEDIIAKILKLNISEKRTLSSSYCEFVFSSKDANQWEEVMIDIFGPPSKPQGVKPEACDEEATEKFGGIRSNQTLFKKEYGDNTVFAMYWPWQDGLNITLKIFLFHK